MTKVAANTLRKGMVVEYNNKLWVVLENELRSPGKGAAVAQVVMRDIQAGNKMDIRFATQDMVERVRVDADPDAKAHANAPGSSSSERMRIAAAGGSCRYPHGPRRRCTPTMPAAIAGATSLSTRSPT